VRPARSDIRRDTFATATRSRDTVRDNDQVHADWVMTPSVTASLPSDWVRPPEWRLAVALADNNATVMSVLLLVFATVLVGQGISGLSG
jgi:hypothetical protein